MTKLSARLLATTAAFASVAAIATPASAQRVDRIVAFGDSYADDGNFFELTGIPRPSAYPNGRFSDQTNFIDTLAAILRRPVDNFAIGGAYTGTGNINGIPNLGFVLEYQSFLAGGGPAAFPRTTGRFGANDLLAISIGGNDARFYRLSGGTVAGAAAAAAPKVAEAQTGLNALVAAGARNITFLAGDVGRLPEAVGQPSAAAGTAFSTAFNNGMQTVLSGYANQGVIVNYLDLNRIGDRVQANPGAYGLTSAGAATSADIAAMRVGQFLFYADNVHLTSAGFAIVGRYAARQLDAPLQLEPQLASALLAADGLSELLVDRLDLASGGGEDGLRVFVSSDFGQRNGADTLTTYGHTFQRYGLSAGAEYQTGQLLIGAAVNYVRGDTELRNGTSEIETEGLQFGGFGRWSNGNAFIKAYAGIGQVDLDIRRSGVIDDLTANPQADTFVAGGEIGYLFNIGRAVRIGPVAGIRYSKADLEAYTETGDQVLALNVQAQEDDRMIASLGLELNADIDMGGARVSPFLIARAEQELEDDPRTIRYALTAAPGIVNQWNVAGGGDDTYGRLAAGANFNITSGLSLQVTGGTTIDRPGGDDSSASVALRVGF